MIVRLSQLGAGLSIPVGRRRLGPMGRRGLHQRGHLRQQVQRLLDTRQPRCAEECVGGGLVGAGWRRVARLPTQHKRLHVGQQPWQLLVHGRAAEEVEQRLAPVLNYPKVRIGALLLLLDQNLPRESWLLSMRMTESIVEIEGVSPDPSRVIERLSALPEFTEVAFSRAIQQDPLHGGSDGKSRFGIRLKLAGIDFEAWRQSVRKRDE